MSDDNDIPVGFGGPQCGGKTALNFQAMLNNIDPELARKFNEALILMHKIPESTLQKVAEFHEVFDTPIQQHPTIPEEDRRELRVELIREELQELEEAEDIVEIADALVDLHYVVMGSVLEYGLQGIFRQLFDEVHDSNMSKLDDEGNPIFREDGKILKSDNYRAPELAKIIFNETNRMQ